MLEHYFVKPSTIDEIRANCLGSQIESYVEWMEVHGYARPTVLRRVPLLFHFAEFAQKRGCTEIASATAFVEEFVSLWLSQHGAGAKTATSLRKHRIFTMRAQYCRCCAWPARLPETHLHSQQTRRGHDRSGQRRPAIATGGNTEAIWAPLGRPSFPACDGAVTMRKHNSSITKSMA
jgi:hypothetical protein